MQTTEIKAQKALALTSITIADYVINPYRGCSFGCKYCYAKRNKHCLNRAEEWGEFVDVKINLADILYEELKNNSSIKRVLIGSTTEVYQHVEKKYKLTRDVLTLLSEFKIPVTILTKSDLIVRDIDILKLNKENEICFTISPVSDEYLRLFEKRSPLNKDRINAVKQLLDNNINVYPHIGPLMPGFDGVEDAVQNDKQLFLPRIDFEIFNYNTMDGELIKDIYKKHIASKYDLFSKVYSNEEEYNKYWGDKIKEIDKVYKDIPHKVHLHPFENYFFNKKGQYSIEKNN
jgi:DNA repair photolyase